MGSLMHWEILDENRIHVLSALLKSAELGEFYMAGGTALSLEMGLRKSEDFDFFVPHGFYPGDLYRQLTNLFTSDNVCEDEIRLLWRKSRAAATWRVVSWFSERCCRMNMKKAGKKAWTKGLVSEKLRSQIEAQTDSEVLDRWVRLTSSVQSVEEFCARITQ